MAILKKLSAGRNPVLLSVVIPAFNSLQFYKPCINSLLKMRYPNFEIIVVDDGSNDGSLEGLRKIAAKNPKLKVIKTLSRRGIPGSRNVGVEVAQGELIAFLDMDMEIGKGWPEVIIEQLEKNSDIGGIVPKVIDFHNREIIQAAGIHIVPHTAWVVGRGYGQKDEGQYDEDLEIAIGAAGSIIRKKVMEQIGGFDESLGVFDDVDMGWRIRLLGWRTFYTPKAIMYHWTSKPWSKRPKTSSMVQYEVYIDNLIRPLLKNLESNSLYKYLPQYVIIMILRILVNLFRGNTVPIRGAFHSMLWNLLHLGETLKLRKITQSSRKIADQNLFENTFIEGSFLSIYFKHLKPALAMARIWTEKTREK